MKTLLILLFVGYIGLSVSAQKEDVIALNTGDLKYGRIMSSLLTNKEYIKLKDKDGVKHEIETANIDFVIIQGYQYFPRKFKNKKGNELLDWLTLEIDGPLKLYSTIDNSVLLDDGAVVCLKNPTRFFLEDDEDGLTQFTESANLVFNRHKVRDILLDYFEEDKAITKRIKDPTYKFRLDDVRQLILEYNHKHKMKRHKV